VKFRSNKNSFNSTTMNNKISLTLKISALLTTFFLGLNFVYAWTAPTATPPSNNVSAPINMSGVDQTKLGDVCTAKGGSTKCLSTSTELPAATIVGQTVRWDGTGWGISNEGDVLANGVTVGRGGGNISSNTVTGYSALASNTTGDSNTATGVSALKFNTTGFSNTANGLSALAVNTVGYYNAAFGQDALRNNIDGNDNTAVGFQSLSSNLSGSFNTATGMNALHYNTSGGSNVSSGTYSLLQNTTGGSNVAVGANALFGNTTGSQNTALGSWANVSIGNLTNTTAVGYGASVDASNKVRIGNNAVTVIGGAVAWSNLSDIRAKDDIVNYTHGLDLITKLRPVAYKLKGDSTKKVHSGFIAQEVEAVGVPFYGLNKPESKDGYYSISYSELVVPLVNSVKELEAENDILRARLEKLEAKVKSL